MTEQNCSCSTPAQPTQSGQSRPSFREVLEGVRKQIDCQYIARTCPMCSGVLSDIAAIIAETYLYDDKVNIKIGGENVPAYLVKEIYRELRADHIIRVINAYYFRAVEIKAKRQYIRTSLYNVFFEAELAEANQMSLEQSFGELVNPIKPIKPINRMATGINQITNDAPNS